MVEVRSHIVEVVVFRRVGGVPQVLVLRRSPDDSLMPGIWQIITGTLEEGEQAAEGALREIREETGLEPLHMWTVPFVNSFFDRARDAVQMIPWFAAEAAPEAEVRLSHEHTEFQWASFEHAASLMAWPGQRQGLGIVRSEIVDGGPASRLTLIPR